MKRPGAESPGDRDQDRAAGRYKDRAAGGGGRARRPQPLPGTGNLAALVAAMRAAGLAVELRSSLRADVSGAAGLAIYRVVQESLANAMRHAPRERILVEAEEEDDGVLVSVTNRLPVGFRPTAVGHGLRTVRARAAAAGVQVEFGAEGENWRVTAWRGRDAALPD